MFNCIVMTSTRHSTTTVLLFPLLVTYFLLLTCWTPGGDALEEITITQAGQQRRQERIGRRLRPDPPVPAVETGDWKPIDYGHPMRDPTLVYVPPVVDPVHYGIHTAEPLWPIRGHKLPPFSLPSDAFDASVDGADKHRRQWLRPAFRPDQLDGPSLPVQHYKQSHPEVKPIKPQTRVDHFYQPVAKQTDRWSSPIRTPVLVAQAYQRQPVQSTGWAGLEDRPAGRAPATIRPSLIVNHIRPEIDKTDGSNDRMDTEPEAVREDLTAKRMRKPSFLNFFIQQGHSKVRKYGSQSE